METTTYPLSGLHCNNCVQRVTKTLQTVEGIETVTVTLEPMQAVITSPAPLDFGLLKEKISDLGFEIALNSTT
jgi:copper chaperone